MVFQWKPSDNLVAFPGVRTGEGWTILGLFRRPSYGAGWGSGWFDPRPPKGAFSLRTFFFPFLSFLLDLGLWLFHSLSYPIPYFTLTGVTYLLGVGEGEKWDIEPGWERPKEVYSTPRLNDSVADITKSISGLNQLTSGLKHLRTGLNKLPTSLDKFKRRMKRTVDEISKSIQSKLSAIWSKGIS